MRDPILLLPGLMCDARVFGPQIDHLSGKYSVQVANLAEGMSIREMAAEALHNAPRRFALCGLSLGGMVAMEILSRAPERVTRIALISTTPLAETPEQAVWREPQIVKAQAGQLAQAMEEAIPSKNIAAGPNRDYALAEIRRMATRLGAETFVRQARAMQRRPDAQKALRMIRAPAMVLCGEQDQITPVRRHSFMAELIPYAELVVIEDAGHLPTLETPDKVNIAMEAWMDLPMTLR